MRQIRVILLSLCLSATALAQQPKQDSSCAKAELRASMAEARLAAELTKEEAAKACCDLVGRQVDQHKARVVQVTGQLAAEQDKSASLAIKISQLEKAIAERDQTIAEQRDAIAAKDTTILIKQQMILHLTMERDTAIRSKNRVKVLAWVLGVAAVGLAAVGAAR